MNKIGKKLFLALLLLTLVVNPAWVSAGVPEAVTYLQAQTPSAWNTMALLAAGQTGVPTDHLKTVSGTLATDYAKAILAVAAAGQNPATFGNIDYVAKLKTFYSSSQIGDANLVNDDVWSVLALASVKDTASSEFSDAKNYIISHQNTDGGWSYSTSGISDTNDTAAAIMALVEAGVSPADTKIVNALNYLKSVQNADGGFGYSASDPSDAGSDAWVISAIYKVGQSPANWNKGAQTPLTHLQTLQDTDGGFWWLAPGSSGNNKAMTAFAVVALAGKSYPIGYYQASASTPAGNFHLRLEGLNGTICDKEVAATTALNIIEAAASACGYTYTITDSSFGRYLSAVNSEAAAGMSGWMYFINNVSLAVGAADYILQAGDEVLWYYGDWGWNPTKVTLDKTTPASGETVTATLQYFNGTTWLPLPNASVKVGSETKTGTADGHLQITVTNNGVYQVYIDTAGFVRSGKTSFTVGADVSQSVSLTAEVEQGSVAGRSIGITVTPTQINFGKLKPSQSANQNLTIANIGTGALTLGGTVTGDNLFISGIKIDNVLWSSFTSSLGVGQNKVVNVSLTVPETYLASGVKNGELIIWANAQ